MEKGSLVLDPTGLLPVKPERVGPGDQRSMVIMTNVFSRGSSDEPRAVSALLTGLTWSPFKRIRATLGGTLEESTSGAGISDRVLARNRGVDSNREARLAFWSSRNKLVLCRVTKDIRVAETWLCRIIALHMADAFARIYLLFLHGIPRVFLLKTAQWEYRWPEKRTQNRTLKRFLCTQPVTFPNENCNFEAMMSIRYGA